MQHAVTTNSFLDSEYAFGVCRIEPENNIHVILAAFENESPMPLVFIGNWDNSEYGRELKVHYLEFPRIHLLDPIYDQEKLNAIRCNCTVYLHGHSCGGTNPSLVEAMYLGLPIIAYDVNFNRETTEDKALYFSSADELRILCGKLNKIELKRLAASMKEIALRRYTWDRISNCYSKLLS